MKRSKKQLPSKAIFSTFLQLNCPSFRLKSVKGLRVSKTVKETKFELSKKLSLKGSGGVRIGKRFPETVIHKIFETN